MLTSLNYSERREHPVDIVEQFAAGNEWSFEREDDDEICILVSGSWSEYQIAFTWLAALEALHVSCAFELKVPARCRMQVLELISAVNEQLWLGHFDLWPKENAVMFRHALPLAGGALPTNAQCENLLSNALSACERFYQAFQFVVWAGKDAREALDAIMFETHGEA